MRKIVLLFMAVLGGLACAVAQNIKVSGTVTGVDGNPIAGATILVEGTTTGTTSGANGRFAIVAPADGSLLVSSSVMIRKRSPLPVKRASTSS